MESLYKRRILVHKLRLLIVLLARNLIADKVSKVKFLISKFLERKRNLLEEKVSTEAILRVKCKVE
jgi:hypothetical protein